MPLVSLHGRALGFDTVTGALVGTSVHKDANVLLGALVRKTITTAQVLALFATPIEIVAAPPAGYCNVLNRITIHKPAGTAYAGVGATEDLVAKYTNAAGAQISSAIETTGFLDQTTVQTRSAGPIGSSGATVGDIGAMTAAAIVLHLLVGEVTTGTSDLIVWTQFDRLPLTLTA